MIKILLALLLSGFLGSGCAPVISKSILEQVNPNISFEDLRKDPGAYVGQTVLLAGVIVKTTNTPSGTILEIYQTQKDWEERPTNVDQSGGRFLAEYNGFLDPEIYSKGKQVTVAGKVTGAKTMKLGELEYRYPCIKIEEIHLWKKKEQPLYYDPYPWYPMGVPWGYWGPWAPYYPIGGW